VGSSAEPGPASPATAPPIVAMASTSVSTPSSPARNAVAPAPSRPPPTVEFRLVEDLRLVTVPMTAPATALAVYVAAGAAAFSAWEGWSWGDGVYFCFVSLMTIGFGDFVPGNGYIYQVNNAS